MFLLLANPDAASASSAAPTTTTTLPPAPAFSAPTAACIKQAAVDLNRCKPVAPNSQCQAAYDAAFPNCFAPGKGVSCAAACAAKQKACSAKVTLDPKCGSACHNQWVAAGGQCSADPTCLADARAAYDACKSACANPPAAARCTTAFSVCLAKCPNLFDPNAPTTTTLPRSTTTTTTTTTTLKPPKTTTTTTLKPSKTTTTTTLKPPKTTTTTTLKPPKTTTTTAPRPTTTTTTLPPLPPFSAPTAACLAQAAATEATCTTVTRSAPLCQAAYYGSVSDCFAPGSGVACAATCANNDDAYEIPASSRSSCAGTCQNHWSSAGARCRGDAACFAAVTKAFSACPGTCAHPQSLAQCRAAFAVCLSACPNLSPFVNNGDGTVTDSTTGLQWETKVDGSRCSHCVGDQYGWSSTGTAPDGTAFTNFLMSLNSGNGGCFAGHCDWRLPTIAELQTLVDLSAPGCGSGSPCIDPVFGPTMASGYWSSTTDSGDSLAAWGVMFLDGRADSGPKGGFSFVRAVRSAP